MRHLFVISYRGSNPTGVNSAIKELGAWFNHFDDTYLLSSKKGIVEVKAALESTISKGEDRLLILEVEIKNAKGWITKAGWDWIEEQRRHLEV